MNGKEIKGILGIDDDNDDLYMNQIDLSTGDVKMKRFNLNFQYQLLMQKYFQSRNDSVATEINIHRLVQSFTQMSIKKFMEIIDSYHNYPKRKNVEDLEKNTLLFQDNEINIRLIVDYETADDEQVKMAESWMRQEMNALRWINSKCTNSSIHTCLMTILQYKGFKAIAQAMMPLHFDKTLVLDLNAPQLAIFDAIAASNLRELAKDLNLIPSYPWRLNDGRLIQMSLHQSIEVHQIKVGNTKNMQMEKVPQIPMGYYLLNLSELMPRFSIEGSKYSLRPEIIQNIGASFTIDKMQLGLKKIEENLDSLIQKIENAHICPLDSEEWRRLLHENGINCFFIGELIKKIQSPYIKDSLMIEMICRTVKIALNHQLREAILHLKDVQALRVDDELQTIVLNMINAILIPNTTESQEWLHSLLNAVNEKFDYKISLEDFRSLPRQALFLTLQHHCAIRFKEQALNFPLTKADFQGFAVKSSNSFSGPMNNIISNVDSLKDLAINISPIICLKNQSSVFNRATIANLMLRNNIYSLAEVICPKNHATMSSCLLFALEQKKNITLDDCLQTLSSCLQITKYHFGENHPINLSIKNRISKFMETQQRDASKFLEKALSIRLDVLHDSIKIFGRQHKKTQDQIILIAKLYQKLSLFEEAIKYYGDALSFCNDKIDILIWISECQEKMFDLEQSISTIKECKKIVDESHDSRNQDRVNILFTNLILSLYPDCLSPTCEGEFLMPSDMIDNLNFAVECYESLLDNQRQRSDSVTEVERLAVYIKRILTIQLRLARPSQRIVVETLRKRNQINNNEGIIKDLLIRLVTGPVGPKPYLMSLLDRLDGTLGLKQSELELSIVLGLINMVK